MSDDTLALALAVLALVESVWAAALPPLSTVADQPDTAGAAGAYRHALTVSSAVVAVVSLQRRSPSIAALGGALIGIHAYAYREARAA